MLDKQNSKIIFSCTKTKIDKSQYNQMMQFYGCFQMGFFAKYQALTVANAIRRTVLSESRHYAITAVKIQNVKHEYSCIRGVKETIFDILLNLQNIILYSKKNFCKTQLVLICETGPKKIHAKDLKFPDYLCCINPNQLIATIESNIQFKMILFIDHISLYSSSLFTSHYYKNLYLQLTRTKQINKVSSTDFLLLNTHLSPVLNFNYTIRKNSNQTEIIIFDIWTDGSIHPSFLLRQSIQKLLVLLIPFYQLKKVNRVISQPNKKPSLSKIFFSKLLKLDLCNFALDLNTYYNLKDLGIFTVGDLYKLITKKEKFLFEKFTATDRIQVKQLLKQINHYISST